MKSGELDKHIGDYAAAIVRHAGLLVADVSNMNADQQQFSAELHLHAVRFQSLYNDHVTDFAELTDDAMILVHDLRNPLGLVVGYCDLLLNRDSSGLHPAQLQLLQQIKVAYTFIVKMLTLWVNTAPDTDNQPI